MTSWLITGANGNLGSRLIRTLLNETEDEVVALVRSARAEASLAADLAGHPERCRIRQVDYTDASSLEPVITDDQRIVHLVGILKETANASYRQAHEDSTQALLDAIGEHTDVHVTYLSIVGSKPASTNACLASKGRAEALLLDSTIPTCVLRVPMVLGEGDYASGALAGRARAGRSVTFRAGSIEQPIYAGDVVGAVRAAARLKHDGALDLGGPEALTRGELTQRAAAVLGNTTRVVSLPIGLGRAFAGLMERLSANPPVTVAMLDVLDHDDAVDSSLAVAALGLDPLTPLDAMLEQVLSAAS